jgi:hypothetical protein
MTGLSVSDFTPCDTANDGGGEAWMERTVSMFTPTSARVTPSKRISEALKLLDNGPQMLLTHDKNEVGDDAV